MPKHMVAMEMELQPSVRGVFATPSNGIKAIEDRKRLEDSTALATHTVERIADAASKENEPPNESHATFCDKPHSELECEKARYAAADSSADEDFRKPEVQLRRSASEEGPRVVQARQESSSSDDDDEQAEGDEDDAPLTLPPSEHFLVKPMPNMQVCPMDDMVVEEEKRIRRSKKNFYAKKKRHCADEDELSSTPNGSKFRSLSPPLRYQPMPPQLRRDSMAIRQQYWTQLGLSLSQRDLERASRSRVPRPEGLKVRLNDSIARRGNSKTIFQLIASWYGGSSKQKAQEQAELDIADASSNATSPSSTSGANSESPTATDDDSTQKPVVSKKKKVVFQEEAELFYIPLHKDYSKRQRDCMWHQRSEFIAMVERNLDEVYDEMEREFEDQALENEAMAQEEQATRQYNQEFQELKRATAERLAAPSPCRSPSPAPAPATRSTTTASATYSPSSSFSVASSSPPVLTLCPQQTRIKLSSRAQTSHAIRFKYLKHLGINNLTN